MYINLSNLQKNSKKQHILMQPPLEFGPEMSRRRCDVLMTSKPGKPPPPTNHAETAEVGIKAMKLSNYFFYRKAVD